MLDMETIDDLAAMMLGAHCHLWCKSVISLFNLPTYIITLCTCAGDKVISFVYHHRPCHKSDFEFYAFVHAVTTMNW